ncbi:putative beta-lysine N-acetyltransferase [Robertmurraya korlensis]|uniref:putative beta-lysine N-acetyltransferase n=1 Tax=Robertmurraya korlensis TaxID=519977 RepID=UPI000824251A|nr:putative beta-lysine N-acetyltransferase [Robertmurraya korlensis]
MTQLPAFRTIEESGIRFGVYMDHFNKRLRVDHYVGDPYLVIQTTEELAKETNSEKIIIKGKWEDYKIFLEKGYRNEAIIDGYFLGSDGYFFCKYFEPDRASMGHLQVEEDIISSVQHLKRSSQVIMPPADYKIMKVSEKEAEMLSDLYREVFQIYPTPLHDSDYVKKTMEEGTIYYAFLYNHEIISAASAEVNHRFRNAELTDCATKKEHRKFGLMKILLKKLEEDLFQQQIFCSYSIARSLSFGMNAVLHQLGYHYRGRLVKNCYIFDKLEDMNVWVKDLSTYQAAENS